MVNCVRLTWLFVGWDLLHGCGLQSTPDGSMQSDRAREVPRGCRNAGWISSSYECLRLTRNCSYVFKIVCSFLCYKFIRHSVILQSIWASLRVGKALLTCSHQPPWLPQRRNHASIRCSATRNSHAPPTPQKKKTSCKTQLAANKHFLSYPKNIFAAPLHSQHHLFWSKFDRCGCDTRVDEVFPMMVLGFNLQPEEPEAAINHIAKNLYNIPWNQHFFAPENGWLE